MKTLGQPQVPFPSPGTPGEGQGEGLCLLPNNQPSPQPSPGVPGEGERGERDCPAKHTSSSRGGFLIIEVVMTISLLVFVFALAGQLFRATILTAAASDRAANQSSRLDDLLRALGRDLWQAADLRVTDPYTVELTVADGHKIIWRINPDNSADRSTPAGPPTHWRDIGLQLQFIRAESGLVLTHSGPPENQRILLVSQVMLGRAR